MRFVSRECIRSCDYYIISNEILAGSSFTLALFGPNKSIGRLAAISRFFLSNQRICISLVGKFFA